VPDGYFDQIDKMGVELERLHHDLLLHEPDLGEEGFLARFSPYQITAHTGEAFSVQVEIRNPYPKNTHLLAQMSVPEGWQVIEAFVEGQSTMIDTACISFQLESLDELTLSFSILPVSDGPIRRARIAVDLTIDGKRFGQQAEALVTLQ
jgi:hypothetical protein